ncbi:MAG: CHAT domain-containing protein [Chloroflexi bacterium]|nr:CHAT domain-containing protein [Chloroflexota bacterium]
MDATTASHLRVQAMIEFEEGNLPQAEGRLNEIIAEVGAPQTRQMKGELCRCLLDRATVRRMANRFVEALEDLATCERLATEMAPLVQRPVLATIYQVRAKMLATPHAGVYDLQGAFQAVADVRKLGWTQWIADEIESDVAFRGKQWDRAARLAGQAATALAAEGWARGAAPCHLRAGLAYLELKDLEHAETGLTAAHQFFQEWGPPDLLASTQLGIARLRSSQGEHDVAWELACNALTGVESLIRRFKSLADQQRFLADKLQYYDTAFTIGLAREGAGGALRAWSVAERSKSFYLCQLVANADVPLFEGVAPEDIEKLRSMEEQLDRCEEALARLSAQRQEEMEAERRRLSSARRQLLSAMMAGNPRWGALKAPPPFDLPHVLKDLVPTCFPVSYFWKERAEGQGALLFIFFAGRDRSPHCTAVPWPAAELGQLEECRQRLRGDVDVFTPVLPANLGEKLFPGEVREDLRDGDQLLISSHGRLQGIPLHAIDLGGRDFLADHWPVTYTPTLALLNVGRRFERAEGVMLMGCPENAFGGVALDDVPGEINELHDLWSARRPGRVEKRIIPPDGSPKQAGMPVDAWGRFDVLHFACHGEFPEGRALDAALLLGADAVRASELFTARLNASLVCLSACSLGRRAEADSGMRVVGDEWIGLYLPLFYAGAANLLVSLWDANSQQAADFMRAFHLALSEGSPAAAAYQKAVKAVHENPATLWANWCLVGAPDTTSA